MSDGLGQKRASPFRLLALRKRCHGREEAGRSYGREIRDGQLGVQLGVQLLFSPMKSH